MERNCRIASIPTADILQEKEHHVSVSEGLQLYRLHAMIVPTCGKEVGEKSPNGCGLFPFPCKIRFSESRRTKKRDQRKYKDFHWGGGGVSLERHTLLHWLGRRCSSESVISQQITYQRLKSLGTVERTTKKSFLMTAGGLCKAGGEVEQNRKLASGVSSEAEGCDGCKMNWM